MKNVFFAMFAFAALAVCTACASTAPHGRPPQQAARQQCEIAIVRIDDLPPPQGQQLADRIRGRLCSQGGQMTGVEDGHRWTAFRAGQTPPPLCTITNIHIDDMPYPQGQAIADVVHARLCADPSLPLEGAEQGHHWTATRAS